MQTCLAVLSFKQTEDWQHHSGPLVKASLTCTDIKLYRRLDDPTEAKYWTDFIKVLLHQRAVFPLPGIWHGTSFFDGFTLGTDVLTGEDKEEVLDRARCLVEACDSPQVGQQAKSSQQAGEA